VTPDDLLRRLDAIGAELERRGDAIALLGLGSVGLDTGRLDEHSDLDFFVIVDDGAKQRYLDSIDWLEAVHPVAYSFRNTRDGRKALFADGIYCEYAVFSVGELAGIPFAAGRVVWRRDDAPAGLAVPASAPSSDDSGDAEFHVNEALTQLLVGLHRDARGERLSGMRLIQVHAVDRVVRLLGLLDAAAGAQQDPFAVERGVERRFAGDSLPLAAMTQGYERNRESALAILEWLEGQGSVDESVAAAIRALAG